jgi:formate dehydrogenase maturation protein FdhE
MFVLNHSNYDLCPACVSKPIAELLRIANISPGA